MPFRVFVSRIAEGVPDEPVQKMLAACGPLSSWRRLTDAATGRLRGTGFAEFAGLEGAVRCLRVINNDDRPLEIAGKRVSVKADNKLTEAIAAYEEQHASDNSEEADSKVSSVIAEIMASSGLSASGLAPGVAASHYGSLSSEVLSIFPGLDPKELDDLPEDFPADQRDVVMAEIAKFRESQAMNERRKRESQHNDDRRRQHNIEVRRQADWERSNDSPAGAGRPSAVSVSVREEPRAPFRRGPSAGPSPADGTPPPTSASSAHHPAQRANGAGPGHDDMEDDEEEDRKKEEKRKHDMELAFRDRERRWETREQGRVKRLEQEAHRERDEERHLEVERERMAKKLAEFDDDWEAERGPEEYFRDRGRYWARRLPFRAREREADERDRQEEAAELASQAAAEAEAMRDIERRYGIAPSDDRSAAAPASSAAAPAAAGRQEAGRGGGMGRIMTAEERKQAQLELVNSLPSDQKSLNSWPLKWQVINETLLRTKIRPFVAKKISEYLGEEVPDVIDFVLTHIRKRGTQDELMAEMKDVLEDDSIAFALVLWRMLIFESESVAQGLT